MTTSDTRDYSRTAAAIDKRDAEVPPLWAQIQDDIDMSQEEFDRIMAEIEALEEAVGVAFGQDTADLNNAETCRQCVRAGEPEPALGETDVSMVRRAVRTWRAEQVRRSGV